MATPSKSTPLSERDLRGSRLRCLLLTRQPAGEFARLLTRLAQPFAVVGAGDFWMPRGLLDPKEAKLGESPGFLSVDHRKAVTDWWLAVPGRANTPNWDIASTCTVEGERGLILVEAKAHSAEMSVAGKSKRGNESNDKRIRDAIRQANEALNQLNPGWNLTADSHYQLCNRFAWSWKIATLGVPVVLVYLGFLNAEEMADQGEPLRSAGEWADLVRGHANGIVPDAVWYQGVQTTGKALRALICAIDMRPLDEAGALEGAASGDDRDVGRDERYRRGR